MGAELGIIRGEGERRGMALEEAGRTRADLARERAGLMVQLTASERDNAALTEELAAFRYTGRKNIYSSKFSILHVFFCVFYLFIFILYIFFLALILFLAEFFIELTYCCQS